VKTVGKMINHEIMSYLQSQTPEEPNRFGCRKLKAEEILSFTLDEHGPPLLKLLINEIIKNSDPRRQENKKELQQTTMSMMAVHTRYSRTSSPFALSVALMIHTVSGSCFLVEFFNKLGVCMSYKMLKEYLTAWAKDEAPKTKNFAAMDVTLCFDNVQKKSVRVDTPSSRGR